MSGKTVPGQRKVPFVGSAGQFAQDPLGFLRGLARDYGDTARFSIFHLPFVLISNPDTVRERRSPHRTRRKLMQPVFHSKRIHSYADVMVNFATMAVDGWQDGEVRKMNGEMMQLTMHIVAKALFDAMLPKYAYFPFGGGPHICIGNAFAAAGAEQAPLALVQNR